MDVNGLVVGDKSTHGGVIITGDPLMTIGGKPVARIGDLHSCPQFYPTIPPIPHAITPIIPGQNVPVRTLISGRQAAVEGDLTGCGAKLIAQFKLTTAISIGALVVGGLMAAASMIRSTRTEVTANGSVTTPNPNNLTDEQITMIDNKVLNYETLYNKIVKPPVETVKETPPVTNENCNCK